MALGETRRKLRIFSLLCAADMIHDMHTGGMTPEDMDMTEKEFDIFMEENERTAKLLEKQAVKYLREND